VFEPIPALAMVLGAGVVTAWIRVADARALRRARRALAPGLAERGTEALDAGAPTLDLGLGEGLLARIARSASAYRGRDRAVALVQGSPEHALGALSRAARRGVVGVAVVVAALCAHAVAHTSFVEQVYEEHQCREGFSRRCARAGELLEAGSPTYAAVLYMRGCDSYDAPACAALSRMYPQRGHVAHGAARVMAAQTEACSDGHAYSCGLAADLFARREESTATLVLLRQMCANGDELSCRAVLEAERND
jgi:hypothetical protein